MNKKQVIIAVIFLLLAIALGALGAHGLKSLISAKKIASFEVGVRYQIYIGLLLLILGLNNDKFQFSLKWISSLLIAGVILFSGSIYLLSFEELTTINLKFLGPITPLGGSLMIVGLGIFVYKLVKR